MTLLLIRHGETALNAARILQPADTPLSPRGLAQAAELAQCLRDSFQPAAIVSSKLPRAWQTAAAIAQATGLALPAHDDPLGVALHERNLGDWRGLAHDSLPGNPLETEAAPPGGESGPDFRARVARAFAAIVELRAALDGPLVVVTHGWVIGEMLQAHASWPRVLPSHWPTQAPRRLRNTSISVLAAQAPHALLELDNIAHLSAALREAPTSLSGG